MSQAQRSRVLSSAVQVIAEHGYGQLSVARIAGGAGVSRRTFYELFEDCEDCFLVAFEEAVARVQELVVSAHEPESSWREQTRATLLVVLRFLDEEPGARALLIVDSLKAGPRVQERRAQVLAQLSEDLHERGSRSRAARELPPLTSEGLIGAVLSVIHTRLLGKVPGSMVDLLNPLMGMIVLPYLGSSAASRELTRSAPEDRRSAKAREPRKGSGVDPLSGLSMRLTHRTLLVLGVIGELRGASNRRVAEQAGITDQGQISKLLARLQGLGLIENSGEGQPKGEPNAWQLTPRGEEIQQAIRAQSIGGVERVS